MGTARKLKRKEYKFVMKMVRSKIKQKAVWNNVAVSDIRERIKSGVPPYRLQELITLRYDPPRSSLKQLANRFLKVAHKNNIPQDDYKLHIGKFLNGYLKGLDDQIRSLITEESNK